MQTKMKFDVAIVPGWPSNIRDQDDKAVPPSAVPINPPFGGFREIGNLRWTKNNDIFCLVFNVTGSGQYSLCTPHTIMRIQIDVETGWPDFVRDETGKDVGMTILAAEALAEPIGGFRQVANLRWYQGSTCTVLNVIGGGQYLFCIP